MNRRALLKCLTAALALLNAAIMAVPGFSFVFSVLRRRNGSAEVVRRVARPTELPVGEPVDIPIVGSKTDAWCVYEAQTIGRIWLVRRSGEETEPGEIQVDAYSATCPHLACVVGFDSERDRFHCPCHEAAFDLDGKRIPAAELGHTNPSPRDLDPLPCRVVQDKDDNSWWVEVTYKRFQTGIPQRVAESV